MTKVKVKCPVCGKGEYKMLPGFDGPLPNPQEVVSHLDCVLKMEQRAKDSEYNFGVEHDALEQAEAENERLKWDREYNAGVAYIAFVAADDMVAKADSADEWMESCRLLASELAALGAEVERLKWMLEQAATTFVHHIADIGIDNADDDDVAEYLADLARRYEEAHR